MPYTPLLPPPFLRSIKKVEPELKKAIDRAIKTILKDPKKGEYKHGDLAGKIVHRFKKAGTTYLIAYEISGKVVKLKLFGPHENFYKILKR